MIGSEEKNWLVKDMPKEDLDDTEIIREELLMFADELEENVTPCDHQGNYRIAYSWLLANLSRLRSLAKGSFSLIATYIYEELSKNRAQSKRQLEVKIRMYKRSIISVNVRGFSERKNLGSVRREIKKRTDNVVVGDFIKNQEINRLREKISELTDALSQREMEIEELKRENDGFRLLAEDSKEIIGELTSTIGFLNRRISEIQKRGSKNNLDVVENIYGLDLFKGPVSLLGVGIEEIMGLYEVSGKDLVKTLKRLRKISTFRIHPNKYDSIVRQCDEILGEQLKILLERRFHNIEKAVNEIGRQIDVNGTVENQWNYESIL